MMVRIEVVRGRPDSATPIVKQAVRFARRLRERCIDHQAVFPLLLDSGATVCKIDVGRRTVNLFADGSCVPSLRSAHGFDRAAFATQGQRAHALLLIMARDDRKLGHKQHARRAVQLAIEERRSHERASSI